MSKNKVSSKEVEDAFFLLNHLSPRVKSLDLPHTRGWSSPLPDAMMNRVGMLGGRAEDVFAQAQQFFQERKQGFTWVMDSHCKLPRASSWMARRSMGHTCTIKGMYLDDLKKSATVPDSILLEELSPARCSLFRQALLSWEPRMQKTEKLVSILDIT